MQKWKQTQKKEWRRDNAFAESSAENHDTAKRTVIYCFHSAILPMPCNHCSYKKRNRQLEVGIVYSRIHYSTCVCLFFHCISGIFFVCIRKKEKYEPVCIKPAGAHLFCDVLRGSVTDKNHTKNLFFQSSQSIL